MLIFISIIKSILSMLKKIVTSIILALSFQHEIKAVDVYSEVDSNVYEHKDLDYKQIIKFINEEYGDNKLYVLRASCIWVCENMSYVPNAFNYNYELNLNKILSMKRGSCNAFSYVLKSLCDSLGIQCTKIDGLTKDDDGYINIVGHSWNVAHINGKNIMLDVTWMNSGDNQGYYDNSWFDTDPKYFIYTHYPFKYSFDDIVTKEIKYDANKLVSTLRYDKNIINGSTELMYYQCLDNPITLEYFLALPNYIKYEKSHYQPLRPYPIKKFWYINK